MKDYRNVNDRKPSRKPDDPIRDSLVYNDQIRYPEVRVIDENNEQLGIMNSKNALFTARQRGLDLVEVTAQAKPPVVKITDIGKWVYNLKKTKKEQEKKARENATVIKEIQLRPVTDKHDIEVKQEHAKNFLAESAKVKVVIRFKGREIGFTEKGFDVLNTFISGLGPCKIEKEPELSGRILSAIVAPSVKKV